MLWAGDWAGGGCGVVRLFAAVVVKPYNRRLDLGLRNLS